MASLRSRIEAILFVAGEPVSQQRLCAATGEQPAHVYAAIGELTRAVADRGFVLRELASGWMLSSNPECRYDVERFLLPPKTSMSQASLETLAIVAYLQPVTRAEVESLRGVNAEAVMNTLEQRRFIRELGRKDAVGRPILYGTTDFFLESFGLVSLESLPSLPQSAPRRVNGLLSAASLSAAE